MADREIFSRGATLIGGDADRGVVVGMGDSISAEDGTECHVADADATFLGISTTRTAEGERLTYCTLGEVDAPITAAETITFGMPLSMSATAGELVEATAGTDVVVAEARGESAAGGEKIPVWVFGITRPGSDYGLA
jgi:hypothetical protein